MECKLFHKEIAEGIYRISDALHGPNEDGYSEQFGAATQNSYLVIGANKALIWQLIQKSFILMRRSLPEYR